MNAIGAPGGRTAAAAAPGRIEDAPLTPELARRPSRPPDHAAENRALGALAQAMAASPGTVLQKLAALVVESGWAQSAGVSVLEPHDASTLRWRAVAGLWAGRTGETMPVDAASPCGIALARNGPVLFACPPGRPPLAADIDPPVREILLVPFHASGRPAGGALWAVAHDAERRFDAEGLRVLTSLARFASAAHRAEAAFAEAGLGREELERRAEDRAEALARANERLAASEERFRALFGLVPALLWRTDPSGREVSLNPRWLEYTGQAPEESQDFGWLAAIHPDDRENTRRAFEEARAAQRPLELEHRIRGRDGNHRWFLVRHLPLRDGQGRVAQWFGAAIDVHEQRAAREALRESRQRLRMALEAARMGVFDWDPSSDRVELTDESVELFGLLPGNRPPTAEEAFKIVHPDDVERHRSAFLEAGAKGEEWRSEYRVVRPRDGETVWVEERGRTVADPETGKRRVRGVHWDVTARKRAEERLHGAFAIKTVGVLFWNEDFGLTDMNDAFLEITGFTREEALGKTWAELTPPEFREHSLKAVEEVTTRGETAPYEKQYYRKDGSRWWGLFAPRRVGAEVVEFVLDITARKEAEAALRESEARQRALIEGVPQLIWRSAKGGEWTWAGPQWVAFTGLSAEVSLGRGWLEALHPDDRPGALAAWAAAGTEGLFQSHHRIRHAASGRYAWFQTRGTPIRGGRGGSVEWLGASTDIDDQVRAREVLARGREELEALVAERTAELMAAEERLRQAQKMEAVGQLTGGIAHDFNNMLQAIAGGLEMARRRVEQNRPGEAGRYLDAAREASNRAAGLTRRLLAFARRQRLDPKPVDADKLVSGLVELIRRTTGPGIAVELRLRGAAAGGRVLCDPNELENAILNLCINARDAMPEGGRLLIGTEDARLSASEVAGHEGAAPGDCVDIFVSDTGHGMAPEVLERVFEPFFTTKPQGQGTGLGLSQVYGFVRQSGGLVRIESAPGRGTTVRLLLPKHAQAGAGGEEGRLAAPPVSRHGGAATVLLVDDEGSARGPTAERLRELGFRVLEAADGPAAVRLMGEGGARIDLLVTDVGLPNGMNGRQVAEAARERWPGLPVLFITGYAGGRLPPGAEVIGKPYELNALARRVQALVAPPERDERVEDAAALKM